MAKITSDMKKLVNADNVQLNLTKRVELINTVYGIYKRCQDVIDMFEKMGFAIDSYDKGIGELDSARWEAVKAIRIILGRDDEQEDGDIEDILNGEWIENPVSEILPESAIKELLEYFEEVDSEKIT